MTRPPLYHWKDTDVGRRALCHILLYAENKAGGRINSASPGDFGVNAEEMKKWILEKIPELEDEHRLKTGTEITGKKMMGRLYNMFTLNPDGTRTPSGEHPTRNENLVGVWTALSQTETV